MTILVLEYKIPLQIDYFQSDLLVIIIVIIFVWQIVQKQKISWKAGL